MSRSANLDDFETTHYMRLCKDVYYKLQRFLTQMCNATDAIFEKKMLPRMSFYRLYLSVTGGGQTR